MLRLIAGLLLATCAVAPAIADDGAAVRLGGDLFVAGGSVSIRDAVSGDALLAGGTIESRTEVAGDVAIAGGDVTVGGHVGEDLYAAGGELEIDARVGGNARIAGGRVRVGPDARIEGGATVAGGTLRLDGTFGRYLNVAGGDVRFGARVLGDVTVHAEELTIEPGTQIDGRLVYHTPTPATLPADATIRGGVQHIATGEAHRYGGWLGNRLGAGLSWVWLIGLFLVGLLIAFALPAFASSTSAAIAARPWVSLGLGLVLLVCVPAVVVVLLITIIGIPLALILMMLYFVALLAGYVIGALFLADRGLALLRRGAEGGRGLRVLALAIVLVLLALLAFVPLLGGLVRAAVLLLGLGAIALALRPARQE